MKVVTKDQANATQNPMKGPLSQSLIDECRNKLLEKKEQLLNLSRTMQEEYKGRDKRGDEVDQSLEVLAEHQLFSNQERIKLQLMEIEFALSRIEGGSFGICEETEESIEIERLRAIPWTRLSIEGAEIREALRKRFAR